MKRKPGYHQVVVWPGTTLKPSEVEVFEAFIRDELKTRAQFLEVITTKPDLDPYGNPVPDTGGRCDLFFAIHDDDIPKFAVPRLEYDMRWVEDALAQSPEIYPERVKEYCSWTVKNSQLDGEALGDDEN